MAAAGNTKRLGQLLNSGTVHPDVSDRHGFTALVAATVSMMGNGMFRAFV